MIDDVKPEDAGDYTFVPDGYALSLSAKLNFLGKRENLSVFFVSNFTFQHSPSFIILYPQRSRLIMFLIKVNVLICMDKSNIIVCVKPGTHQANANEQ